MTAWTAEASSRLVELYDEGRSASVISDLLHREGLIKVTRNAIIGRAHRLKLPARAARKQQRKPKQQKQQRQNERRREKRAEQRKTESITMDWQHALRCEPIDPLSISLHELTDDTCHFPFGDRAPYRFCGHSALAGYSWCLVHAARCFGRDR